MNLYNSMDLVVSAMSTPGVKETVDAVDNLSSTINEYGLLVVIMAVFIIVFLLLMFLIMRNNANMMKTISNERQQSTDLEDELLSKFVDGALKKLLEKPELSGNLNDSKQDGSEEVSIEAQAHKDLVGTYIDVNMAFKDASRATQSILECDRIAIYVFHNGNSSLHGLPFFKMSCIHEWTTKGSNTLRGKSHIDLPLHLFDFIVQDLWTNGIYRSEDVEKSKETDPSIEEFVIYSKTKALYMKSIKDDDNVMAGFVVAEFDKEDSFEHDEARNNAVRSALEKMATRVTPILMYHSAYGKKK